MNESIKTKFNDILNELLKKDKSFYIQDEFDYSQKPFLFRNKKIEGRSVSEVRSPSKPQKRTIEKYIEIYSLIDFKNFAENKSLPTKSGIYIFVANKDFVLNIRDFFQDFVVICKQKQEIMISLSSTPRINLFKGEIINENKIIKISANEIFYVGQSKNIHKRINQHYDDKLNQTSSLKLGIRTDISQYLDLYYQVIHKDSIYKNGEFESYIRKFYGVRVGK